MSKKQLNFILGLLAVSILTDTNAEDVPRNAIRTVYQAPPEAPPAAINESPTRSAKKIFLSATPTLYSIGDPSDEEQLYLEYINRARANPPVEGQRLINTTDPDVVGAYNFFQVDLPLVDSQFAAIAAAPPLSMNEKLLTAARLHTQDMFENQLQGHDGTIGCPVGKVPCDPYDRMTFQGYDWTFGAENVFAFAKSVFYGHAGLDVDWGGTPENGGIQSPPGHRNNIHDSTFREVGIGVLVGSNGSVGPQLVTQDFGSRAGLTPMVTGVAYYDFNGNGFYDLGEGIGAVKVSIPESTFYAITANSGGYSVPVPGDGNYTVTFGAPGLADTQTASVTGNNNVKIDFVPAYAAPTISGPDQAVVNQNNIYQSTAVGAAGAYQWKQDRRVPFTATEGAENGLAKVTAEVPPDYPLIANDAKASGSVSFHLAHLDTPTDQSVTLNRLLLPGANSDLIFFTRLGWATSNQVARAQISSDGGKSWQDVWSKAGTEDRGETSFHQQVLSLAAYAGSEITVRFIYQYLGGVYFNNAAPGVGFYLDDISFTGAEELVDTLVTDVPSGASFNFTPTVAGEYSLRVRAKVANRFLDYGPARLVTAKIGQPPPSLSMQITRTEFLSGNQIQIDFVLLSGSAGTFRLESAPSPVGAWAVESGASISPLPLPGKFRATSSIAGVRERYFRISDN